MEQRHTLEPMTATKRTARLTGVAYLGLAISGVLGFLVIRSQLFEPGDAATTAMNLMEREGLARLGIAVDLTVVLTQALAALYFFKLFRDVNTFAAGSLAAFGFMNAAAILVATAFSATALEVTLDGAAPTTALLLYDLNTAAWGVGSLFFGLWLIPMGWLAMRSGFMPRPLGWILIAGGVGYILSAYASHLVSDADVLADALTVPAAIGEFWIIAYLLIIGVRPAAVARSRTPAAD
jgi:hypothetical protein